jgi:hypothetical protein
LNTNISIEKIGDQCQITHSSNLDFQEYLDHLAPKALLAIDLRFFEQNQQANSHELSPTVELFPTAWIAANLIAVFAPRGVPPRAIAPTTTTSASDRSTTTAMSPLVILQTSSN